MRAAANVVEAAQRTVAVRLAEVGGLLQRRFHGEGVPVWGEEFVAEGEWCPAPLHHDAFAQAGEAPVFKPGEGAVSHALLRLVPVVARAQVRDGEEDRDRVTTRGRHGRFRARRCMDVDGVAAWHASIACHILDEAVVIVAHHKGVMQQLLKLPVCAEIHHVRRHGGAQRSEAPREEIGEIWKECIARRHITVVDHKICIVDRSISGPHANRASTTVQDLINFAVECNTAAHLIDDLSERLNDAVDATLGVPDAVSDLQVGECRIDCRDARRIATNEERVEPERLLHMWLLEELGNPTFKETDRIKLCHGGEELDEVGELQEVLATRDQNALTMNITRRCDEGIKLRGVYR